MRLTTGPDAVTGGPIPGDNPPLNNRFMRCDFIKLLFFLRNKKRAPLHRARLRPAKARP